MIRRTMEQRVQIRYYMALVSVIVPGSVAGSASLSATMGIVIGDSFENGSDLAPLILVYKPSRENCQYHRNYQPGYESATRIH